METSKRKLGSDSRTMTNVVQNLRSGNYYTVDCLPRSGFVTNVTQAIKDFQTTMEEEGNKLAEKIGKLPPLKLD